MSLELQSERYSFGNYRDNVDDIFLDDNEAALSENFDISVIGQYQTLKKRPVLNAQYPASNIAAPTAVPVRGVYQAHMFDSSERNIWMSNGLLYNIGTSAPYTVTNLFSVIGAWSTTLKPDFEHYTDDKIYITNGSNTMVSWAGDVAVLPVVVSGSPPVGKYIKNHRGYLFLGNLSTAQNKVQYSALTVNGGAGVWPALNYFTFDTYVTGLASNEGVLFVFENTKTWMMEGTDFSATVGDAGVTTNTLNDVNQIPFNTGIGCVSGYSIIEAEGSIFFLSNRGFCEIRGMSEPEIISDDILGTLSTIRSGNHQYIEGHYDIKRRWLTWAVNLTGTDNNVSDTSLANAILVLDLNVRKWKKFLVKDGFISAVAQYEDYLGSVYTSFGNDVGRVLYLNDTTGVDFVDESTTSTVDFKYHTKPLFTKEPDRLKSFKRLRVYLKSTGSTSDTITIKYSTDRVSETTTTMRLTRSTLGSLSQSSISSLPYVFADVTLESEGLYIIIKFESTSQASPPAIALYNFEIFYTLGQKEMNLEEV